MRGLSRWATALGLCALACGKPKPAANEAVLLAQITVDSSLSYSCVELAVGATDGGALDSVRVPKSSASPYEIPVYQFGPKTYPDTVTLEARALASSNGCTEPTAVSGTSGAPVSETFVLGTSRNVPMSVACDGGNCGGCPNGQKPCGSGCIPAGACCSASDCLNGEACDAGACACPAGTGLCNGTCTADAGQCCADTDCSGDGGSYCSNHVCKCDQSSCDAGCCEGAVCHVQELSACGSRGRACMACDSATADNCAGNGTCACGTNPPCNGLHCVGGACVCDGVSCPTGCCNGGTCDTSHSPNACGLDGGACVACGNNADTCSVTYACGCGSGAACFGLTDNCQGGNCQCGNGAMTCGSESDTCDAGTCTCGVLGPCSGGTDRCDAGACYCGNGAACPAGQFCINGACTYFTFLPSNWIPTVAPPDSGVQLLCNASSDGLAFSNPACWDGGRMPVVSTVMMSNGSMAQLFSMSSLIINNSATLTLVGSRPIILGVYGDVNIGGAINASAVGSTPGAGGNSADCVASAGQDGGGSGGNGGGGGGGGGYGATGANGGDGDNQTNHGAGGQTSGSPPLPNLIPLRGGCPGGWGGLPGSTGGNGGAGGGGLEISASGTLTLNGTINAAGGGGDGGFRDQAQFNGAGGGGGGSGGGVLLEANTMILTNNGWVTANGGGGGGAGDPGHGTPGQGGQNGQPRTANVASGGQGNNQGGNGGSGGTGSNVAQTGQGAGGGQAGGGGGGGEIGVIDLRANTCNNQGHFSPAPTAIGDAGC